MSAEEIRMLADNCKDASIYYKNMTPCSDAEKEKWYYDASKMEADKAAALLAYAAMIERCERVKIELPFDAVINTANYILRGDGEKKEE